jgi:ribulose-phosphate 3-epimerase
MKFYPALLSDSLTLLNSQLQLSQSLPQVKVVQIDIIDGLFADNLTVSPSDLMVLDFGKLKLDLHLITEEPLDFVHEALECTDSLPIRGVVAQIERMSYQDQYVTELKKNKLKVGISLDLFTPISEINENIFPDLNYIQLMAIEAGFQGQKLNESIYQKVADLKQYLTKRQLQCEIIVDGGVKLNNLEKLKQVGVDAVAVGSMLWTAENPREVTEIIFTNILPHTKY